MSFQITFVAHLLSKVPQERKNQEVFWLLEQVIESSQTRSAASPSAEMPLVLVLLTPGHARNSNALLCLPGNGLNFKLDC